MSRSKKAALTILAAMLLAAVTARAETSLSVRSSNRIVSHASFDMLADNDLMPQLELNAAHAVLSVYPIHLWVEGSYLVGSSKNKIFNGQAKAWSQSHTVVAGLRLSVPVRQWLEPMVRVSAGVVIGRLGLKALTDGGQSAEDWNAAFSMQALGGVAFKIPRVAIFKRFTVGIVVEGGYTYTTELDFHLEPEVDDDLRLIPMTGATLGSLNLSGPMFTVGALVQF